MASTGENPREGLRTSCNRIVRRMVRLPLSIIEGISRSIGHGGPRRNQDAVPVHRQPQEIIVVPEEWFFLTCFEQEFGNYHPFFYACPFVDALKIAKDESKLVFVYLHDPEHPYTAPFCHDTLCSQLAVEFLDANLVSWGAVAGRGEGLEMATALQAASFPFCAVVAPASGKSIAVLQQIEGPVSPSELVEILQRTIEEQGPAFRNLRAAEETARKANSRLREEQDAAYLESLQKDKEKDRAQGPVAEGGAWAPVETWKKANGERLRKNPAPIQSSNKQKEAYKETQRKETAASWKALPVTKILVRFPNGARKEQSFLSTDTIRSIYKFIDSLDISGIGSYRLISNFPKKVHGYEQLDMTLKDAGLHPSATLFLELLKE